MSMKAFGLLAPLVCGGLYFTGALGGGYARDVDGTPARVMAAVADLDIREQPGSPGTDPGRSGGVRPAFRTERTANSITWIVLSGNQVATRMTATFEPLDGGRRTRITAQVARGDAPDDLVSPAFRSEGLTLGLFSMALESELDEMVAPQGAWNDACQRIMDRFESGAYAPPPGPRDNLKQAVGETMRTIGTIREVRAELLRNGCNPDRPGGESGFRPISNVMGSAPPASTGAGGASFEPGRPMVDPSRDRASR